MNQPAELWQWVEVVSNHLSGLTAPQAMVLALYSFGMVIGRSCGQTTVAAVLAQLLGEKEGAVRQRLREWCYDAKDKKGEKRQEVDVEICFAPLLKWILAWWEPGELRLALALDASTLGQRFTVLSVSVVYRGCGIPVAWVVLAATKKEKWKPHWLRLIKALDGVVPSYWTVIVLTDRGLYAKWLYKEVVKMGWHPFMRLNKQGKYRPKGQAQFRTLASAVPAVGTSWAGEIDCFKTTNARLSCTLLARWDEEFADPWLIITDLSPIVAEAVWYGMRGWIECQFKDTKRGGWRWEQTKMTDPKRATRLWLVIAVATLWVVSVGGAADADLPASSFDALPETHIARRRASGRLRPRLLSCFVRGIVIIVTSLIKHQGLPLGRFIDEPWPIGHLAPPSSRFQEAA